MKQNFANRLLSLLMVLIMLLGLIPLQSLATEEEEEEEDNAPLLGAIVDTNDEEYKNLNNVKAGLKALAALQGYPGVGAVIDGAFGAFFGTDTDRIQAALAKISQKLDEIQAQMRDLTEYLARKIDIAELKNTLKTRVDKYTSVVPSFSECNNVFLSRLDKLKKKDIETAAETNERLEATKAFYLNTVKNTTVGGDEFFQAVLSLGATITMVDPSNGLDLFTAFDKQVLYSFNWEHHGYRYRIAFQSHVMALYTSLSSIALAGLTVNIDDAETRLASMSEGQDKRILMDKKENMETQRENLKAQIIKINELVETHPINIRPSDQRYYQVPGHELLLKTKAIPRTGNPTYPNMPGGWVMCYDLFGGILCYGDIPNGFKSKYNPSGYLPVPSDGISAPYPSPAWFISVYKDYGGTKDMYEIFFSENEGGFDNSSIQDLNSDPIPPFVTNEWWKAPFPFIGDYYVMRLFDKSGKLNDSWVGTVITSGGALDGMRDWNPHMMIGLVVINVLKAGLPSGDEMKISGMADNYKAPYSKDINLTVEDKGELYTYEWQVNRDGHGFMPIDDANSPSYAIGKVDASMSGYQYRCQIVHHALEGDAETLTTDPVTLNLMRNNKIITQKTRDNMRILLFSLLAVICIAFVITLIVVIKKRRNKAVKE